MFLYRLFSLSISVQKLSHLTFVMFLPKITKKNKKKSGLFAKSREFLDDFCTKLAESPP